MKRILLLTCVAAMALSLTAGPVAAAPTNAKNYEAFEAECDNAGSIVIEVVAMGQWSTGKVQGTKLTGIPRLFEFSATHLETGTVVFEESIQKRNAAVDDLCRITFVETIPEDNPDDLPGGDYRFDVTVGVKVVGPR
jgi:hypothetical protein